MGDAYSDHLGTDTKLNERDLLEIPLSKTSEACSELFPEIIGKSPALIQVLNLVKKIAHSSSAVLILGQSGTGKELIASAIHRLSERKDKKFVAINCSAIPEDLLEAELFGYEKGAFTGATKRRIGYFGVADGGTIFLDEIGDTPARLQSKLLRVLQEKQYTPIGSNSVRDVDVRIIAATNRDLENAVKENQFRLDLFYRLNVLPITLPSLKERKEDIALLIKYFSERLNSRHSIDSQSWFDQEAIEILSEYYWPGNVRQLQNLVERLLITHSGGAIKAKDLPLEFLMHQEVDASRKNQASGEEPSISRQGAVSKLPKEGFNLDEYLENLENDFILQALERANNNKSQASKLLGLNRTTLVEKLKKRKIIKDV